MRVRAHIIISLFLAVAFYYFTRDFFPSLVCFISGILIDIDHIIDYFLTYTKIDIKKIWHGNFHKDKLFVFLHSFELLLVLFWFNPYTVAFGLGFAMHLLMDSIAYDFKNNHLAYFLTYRASKRFELVRI